MRESERYFCRAPKDLGTSFSATVFRTCCASHVMLNNSFHNNNNANDSDNDNNRIYNIIDLVIGRRSRGCLITDIQLGFVHLRNSHFNYACFNGFDHNFKSFTHFELFQF